MKTLALSILVFVALGCSVRQNGGTYTAMTDATGKGNGGEGVRMSTERIQERVLLLKPNLILLFEGLQNYLTAEALSPGSTDLARYPQLKSALEVMLTSEKNVYSTLSLEQPFAIQSKACLDIYGLKKAMASPAAPGSQICASLEQLQAISPLNAPAAADISMIGLAVHELSHQLIRGLDFEKGEALGQGLEGFIGAILSKSYNVPRDVYSYEEMPFVYVFNFYSKDLLEQIRSNQRLGEKK